MALQLTIEDDGKDVDLVLYKKRGDDDAMDIFGIDIEAAVAGEALGIDPPQEFWLYQHYRNYGLDGFIRLFPVQLHDAFEEQGYDVFSDESYDRSEFLQEVSSNLQSAEESMVEENIEVLEYAVRHKEYDKEELISDLIEGFKTFADSDHHEFEYHEGIIILQQLAELLPFESFKFVVNEPVKEEEESDFIIWYLGYSALINGEEIISWGRNIYISINDPISFDLQETDPCDDNPESCPSPLATTLMDMMGWSYPEPDIEFPDIPESVYGGDWGVQYIKYETQTKEGTYYIQERTGRVIDTQVVEYETKKDAMAAAELSSEIFSSRGRSVDYDINIVRWDEDADEWTMIERFQ